MAWFQFGLKDLFYLTVIAALSTSVFMLNQECARLAKVIDDLEIPGAISQPFNPDGKPGEKPPGWRTGRNRS